MESYNIEWKSSARRDLKNLDKKIIPSIIKLIETLPKDPYPHGIRKIQVTSYT